MIGFGADECQAYSIDAPLFLALYASRRSAAVDAPTTPRALQLDHRTGIISHLYEPLGTRLLIDAMRLTHGAPQFFAAFQPAQKAAHIDPST